MKYYIDHENKDLIELKKQLRKLRRAGDQDAIGECLCLIEEKEAALILVRAAMAASEKLGGAL